MPEDGNENANQDRDDADDDEQFDERGRLRVFGGAAWAMSVLELNHLSTAIAARYAGPATAGL